MVLRTLAMPADTNANGDIFGGWLMSQMDIGGAIMAKEIAHGRVVTVRVDDFEYEGRPYRSLSAIARHITGTRWNGWTFFGLRARGDA